MIESACEISVLFKVLELKVIMLLCPIEFRFNTSVNTEFYISS